MTEIRDALLLHLKQSGFISYDDGTVALFKGSFAVGEDSVTPIVWTSAERLADTILARFELRDRQAGAAHLAEMEAEHGTVVHAWPPGEESETPCCRQSPFGLPRWHRITADPARVTCRGRETPP